MDYEFCDCLKFKLKEFFSNFIIQLVHTKNFGYNHETGVTLLYLYTDCIGTENRGGGGGGEEG